MGDFRERIYCRYVEARSDNIVPASVEKLRPRAAYLNNIIRSHFPADRQSVIVDLGCGHGAFVYFIRRAGYQHVSGIDRSRQQVDEAQRLGIEGVREGDLLATLKGLSRDSVDVIIGFDVIEHFTKDELLQFVDEVNKVLRKGGVFIIHAPNGESPFFGRIRYGDITHELAFTRGSISQLVLASGFSRVDCHEDMPLPYGVRGVVRWIAWKIIRGMWRFYLLVETGTSCRECIFSQNFLAVVRK